LHSGNKTVEVNDKYTELITNVKKIGPIYIQSNVAKEVKSDNYDIIIIMSDLRWINNILAMCFHNKKAKFIWWGAWLTDSYIANKARVYLANKQYASILYTHEAKDDFIALGVNEKKLFVANNTFDVGERIKSYENDIKNTILFVGSLDKRKQNDILINAFSNIKSVIGNDINLIIVGDGSERKNLESLVKKLDLEGRVFFKGKITDTNILRDYYKKAIVSVSFGQAGLSVLQSLGYGVPFLTKRNAISGGEKTNIKHKENGLFCDDSIESLEENLIAVCTDIDYARELGKNAYNYYSEFCTIENMVQGFRDAIENTRLAK
jgi:glycosyltransferase involved in cell wall biosynthesis